MKKGELKKVLNEQMAEIGMEDNEDFRNGFLVGQTMLFESLVAHINECDDPLIKIATGVFITNIRGQYYAGLGDEILLAIPDELWREMGGREEFIKEYLSEEDANAKEK